MSLLVDPEYFLHNLRLNYLRRLPDPIGPSSISFPNEPRPPLASSDSLPEQGPSTPRQPPPPPQILLTNPYIQLSGLSDSQRWPELLVRGSPPEPFSVPINGHSNDQTPIRTRRRRADGSQLPLNPSGTALRYSETIVGPKGGGIGAGMRVSGRKSIRSSRQPPKSGPDHTNPTTSTPPISLPSQSDPTVNAGANALALTEGRASVIPGGGLNPEDSDEDHHSLSRPSQPSIQDESNDRRTTISRNPTTATIRTHRRRVSAVTFANSAFSFTSPPGSILNLSMSRSRTRAQRGHSISSIATTNTVISSEFSENANQTIDSPTLSQLRAQGESASQNPKSAERSDSADQLPSPLTQPRLETKSNADVYYSTEHDPDKRMSDLLFTRRPFDAKRSTQIVGRVELEPAPLLEADNEDDTGDEDIETDQTDTGTELGEDDSSFNPDENEEDTGLLDDSISVKSRRQRLKRDVGSIGTSLTDPPHTEEIGSSVAKSFPNTLATSVLDSNPLDPAADPSTEPLAFITAIERPVVGNQSPPILRRRERRRVNIKMGQLVGPPIIEEDSVGPPIDSDPLLKKVASQVPNTVSSFPRASSVSRPSLPDLRQALQNPVGLDPQETSPHESTPPSGHPNSFSPGRARALTTPTPIPHISVDSTCKTTTIIRNLQPKPPGTSSGLAMRVFATNRFGAPGSSVPRLKRGLLQTAQASSDPNSSNGLITPTRKRSLKTGEEAKSLNDTPVSKASSKMKRPQLSFEKIALEDPKLKKPVVQKSILTQLLNAQSSSSSIENPFRCFYALLASKERNALKITLYYPFSQEPRKPIRTSMKPDVCVEEVVGFALWSYVEEMREPKLDEIKNKPELLDLNQSYAWCLRLVEDDGEVDEDFPALERTRPAAKVGSNEFAIVMATVAQAQQNETAQSQIQRRPSRVLGEPKQKPRPSTEPPGSIHSSSLQPPITAVTGTSGTIYDATRNIGGGISGSLLSGGYGSVPLGGSSLTGAAVYLKIRIPSPGRGVDSIITTMNVTTDMYLADVLETLVKKKSLGHVKDWALLVPSSPSIPTHQRDILVPLDRTVQSLQGVNSLALVKRTQVSSKLLRNTRLNGNLTAQNTNPSASIFKRLSEVPQPKYVSITDITSSSKTFLIQTKRRGILGKSDRLLTIEDDYVHISPNHTSMNNVGNTELHLNDNTLGSTNGKVSSYHISQIVDCIFRPQTGFKLIVLRDSGEKRYDVEAENAQSANEIVRHIKGLKEMYHSTRT